MTKRKMWVALLVSGLALVAVPMTGCGDDEDPSAVNQDQDPNNETPNNDDPNNETPNNDDPNNETPNNGPNDDPNNGPNDDPNQQPGEECEAEDWFTGAIGESDTAVATTEPHPTDSGLSEVQQALDDAWDFDDYEAHVAEHEDSEGFVPHIIDLDFSEEPIEIEGAVITMLDFPPDHRLWVGDSEVGMYVLKLSSEDAIPGSPEIGQRVNFKVERADIYQGEPQIRAISDWEVVDLEDGEEATVPYIEITDQEITKEEHFNKIIRVGGVLGDDPFECGTIGSGDNERQLWCFDMYYGDEGEHSVTYRSSSDFDDPGDCITFVGPVGTFPGYYFDYSDIQLNAVDWDWVFN